MIFHSRSPFLFGILVSGMLAACALQAPVADGEAAAAQTPGAGAAAFLVGQAASRSGDLAIAASAWQRALEDDPGNLDLLHRAHLSELGAGNFDAAVKIARRLAALGASDSYTQIVLALDDARAGRLLAADASLAKVADQGVNVILGPLLRAWLAAGNRERKTAEALLTPLRDASGFGAMRDLHLMLMADYTGDRSRALALAHDILRDDPSPTLRVAAELGAVLERYESQSQARKFYQSYGEQNPDSPLPALALARLARSQAPVRPVASVKEGLAEALFDLASLLHRDRAGSELALLLNQMALAMRPDFVFARLLLADIYESQFKPALAAELFRSMAHDPLFGWAARLRLANNLDALGDTDGALRELRAMAIERADADSPLTRMGDLLRSRQRWDEAIAVYNEAIERIGALDRRHWSILFSRAICLERTRQVDQAIADLEQALIFEPDEPYLLNYLGYSWVDRGVHLTRATAMIEKAVQLRPNDGHIVDSLGWAHYRQGRFQEAVIQLERAVELKPVDPTINDHLGDAYWQAGRKLEARNQWLRSQSMDPEPELQEQLDAKLKGGGLDALSALPKP